MPDDAPPEPSGPLAGVRVLDLTSGVAGPWCTKLLATYGAAVIKVERPGTGDPSRGHGRFPGGVPHREKSALLLWLNTGKRSLTLDVTTTTGRDIALRVAAQSMPLSSTGCPLACAASASRGRLPRVIRVSP
jgi:crotonobetainyl-CoA:carnitine CoA-transferase CaiB-like acyl-CoA transferase